MSVTLTSDAPEPVAGLLADGTPDPEYAAALGLVPAPLGRRAGAFAIDVALLAVFMTPLIIGSAALTEKITALVSGGQDDASLALVIVAIVGGVLGNVLVIVQLALHGLKGFTIGKRLTGLRTVHAARLGRPGFWRIVLRALIVQAAYAIVPLVGAVPFLLSPMWDPQKRGRGWHDRATSTWMVDIKQGIDPYDDKVMRHARRAVENPVAENPTGLPSLATAARTETPFVPGARLATAVVGGPQAGSVIEPPPAPATPQLPPPVAGTGTPADVAIAILTFDDGARYQVSGTGLIGRNPAAAPGEDFPGLLAIADASSSMSKTHAAYGVEAHGFWVADRSSTNGTSVRVADGSLTEVSTERTAVPWGATVLLGDRYFVVSQS